MAINRKKIRNSAQKQLRKGNWRKALQYYEQLVEDDENDVRSRLKIADLHSRLGEEEAAVQAYVDVGNHHADQDIYQKAVAVYKQALRINPDNGDLQRKLGEAYHRLNRLRDATQAFGRALQAYKRDGDVDNQIDVLEQLVRLDPDDVGVRIQLAENYAKVQQRDDALEMFRTAAEHLYEEGRSGDFTQVAERIIYFDPDDVQTRKRLIRQYIDLADHKRALKHLRVCFNNDPEDIEILRLLAETFLELDRTDKAVMVYRKLATQHQKRDHHARAEEVWETVLELKPGDAAAERALEKLEKIEEERTAPKQPEPAPEPPPPEAADAAQTGGPGDGRPEDGRANGQADGDQEIVDLSDSIVPLEASGDDAGAEENAQTAPDSASETDSTPTTPTSPIDAAEQPAQEPDDELAETLDEADVFIKYGLHDKAREVLQKLARMAPDDLRVYEKRRDLYDALDETQAEARTLMRMAEMAADTPQRARGYLEEALELSADPDEVRQTADDLGIALDGAPAEPAGPAAPSEPDAPPASPPPEQPAEANEDRGRKQNQQGLEGVDLEPVGDIEAEDAQEAELGSESSEEFVDIGDFDMEFLDDSEAGETSQTAGQRADGGTAELGAGGSEGEVMDLSSAAEGFEFDLDEGALDELFSGVDDDEDEPLNLGSDDPAGDMAEIDFYIQQGLYDDAEDALEAFAEANPDHPGIDKRRFQIRTARQGGKIEENPSGAESLSTQFESESDVMNDADEADDGPAGPDGVTLEDVDNTNLEVGTAYRDMGLYDEAIEEFERALDDPDAAPQARYQIAVCKLEMGETDDAADTLNSLIDDGAVPGELRSAAEEKLQELDAPPAE